MRPGCGSVAILTRTAAEALIFVLTGDLNRSKGCDGPAPTDNEFETVDIARQYDGFADHSDRPVEALR